MGDRSSDWQNSWNKKTPKGAAKSLVAHFGSEARSAARHCIEAARAVGRETDLHFWQAVLDEINCGEDKPAELQDRPIAMPTSSEWRSDDFLSRISSESTPLDASILAALTLKYPQERLRQLELKAHCEGRRAEERFWHRAQQLLLSILSPSAESDKTSEGSAFH